MKIDYPIQNESENLTPERCPVLYALDIVGQKWKLPILWYLFSDTPVRYNELKRKLAGITNVMLTKSLKELEADKLINRVQYNEIPPRVEYSLTARGKELLPALNELYKWGEVQMKQNEFHGK